MTGRFWGPLGPSLCLTVLRVLVISSTCYFRLVSGVRRRYFWSLLTVCNTRRRSMEPLWNYPPYFGHVALLPQASLVLRLLMLCFVPVLTSDLLPIPFKQFLLQRTRHCLPGTSHWSYPSRRNHRSPWRLVYCSSDEIWDDTSLRTDVYFFS